MQAPRVLSEGAVIQEELKTNETHRYRITLSADDYLATLITERGTDVKLRTYGPNGAQILEENTTRGNYSILNFRMIAPASGEFLLEVVGLSGGPGGYELRLEALHPATERDRNDVKAFQARQNGQALEIGGTADSLRKSMEQYRESLVYNQANGDRKGEGQARRDMGRIHFYLDERSEAAESFEQAAALFRSINDTSEEADALLNLGAVYQDMGDPLKAIGYFNQTLPFYRESKVKSGEATVQHNLGWAYHTLGDFRKASEAYRGALPLWQVAGIPAGEAQTVNNLGLVLYELGDLRRSLAYFERALELRRTLKDGRGEAQTLGNLGWLHAELADSLKAKDFFQQSLAVARNMEDKVSQAMALTGLASVGASGGGPNPAMEYLNEALNLGRAANDRRTEAFALLRLGDLHHSRGENQLSLEMYEQALAIQTASGNHRKEAETLLSLARLLEDGSQLDEARVRIEAALKLVESMREGVSEPELRITSVASMQAYHETYIDLLMRLEDRERSGKYAAAALQASERARARGLLEALLEHRADIRQGVEPELLEREKQLQAELNMKDQQWRGFLAPPVNAAKAAAARRDLDRLLDEFGQLQGEIRSRSPRYALLTQPEPMSVEDLQRQLDEDSLLLEYWLGSKRSFLWAVTPNSVSTYILPPASRIEESSRQFFAALTTTPRPAASGSREPGAALSQMLLNPVADRLGKKRLIVVSHGALQYLPFAAMPAPASAANKAARSSTLLLDDHEIISLPSAGVLAALRSESAKQLRPDKQVAILADPVFSLEDPRFAQRQPVASLTSLMPPNEDLRQSLAESSVSGLRRLRFSRVEADAIASLVDARNRFEAVDFEASRATALSPDLAQYRILHFATHGLLNSLHPELSGLVFSTVDKNGQPQDGLLRLNEIFNLSLNAELVVLSACETALGKEIKGEGLIGLTRGFMYAGAPRVVASLWKVEDRATAELMKRFYEGMLKRQLKPAAALREAQLALSRDKRWSAPYYWAAFILQGEWR
ncbi:MAG TPA: CHAT domain-containing tetratricopeptide repeat protein [Terriglobia bacterium]|nr:CHAT domain-containing tetratricopeptide repeat protein [Terriglobia bacterium]